MARRSLPGLGLSGFWDTGEDGWNFDNTGPEPVGMDVNMRLLSAIVGALVKSTTTNLPGTPAVGDIYIVPTGQPNENALAIWDGEPGSEAWVYVTPGKGWIFLVDDTGSNVQWNGSSWAAFAGGGGATNLNSLTDVSTVGSTTGQALTKLGDGTFAFRDVAGGGGGGGGRSETLLYEQDAGATTIAVPFNIPIGSYDEIMITGDVTDNATLDLLLSNDGGSTFETTYFEQYVNAGVDGGGDATAFELSRSGGGTWTCRIQNHDSDTHPTRVFTTYGNGTNFFEIRAGYVKNNNAHDVARINFTGTVTGGVVRVIGINYGGSDSATSQTELFTRDFTTSPLSGNQDIALPQEYDAFLIEGTDTDNNFSYRLSTDGGATFLDGATDYLNGSESGSSDTSALADDMFVSSGATSYWHTEILNARFAGTRTRLQSHVQNTSGFSRYLNSVALAPAAHDFLRIIAANATTGSIRVYGIKNGAGGNVVVGQGGASSGGDGIATHSTGDFGVGTATPERQLHIVTDPGETSILTAGDLPDFGGILIEANGPGAGPTGPYPGLCFYVVNAGCGHIHWMNQSGHWVAEYELNMPTKEWRWRIGSATDGSRPPQKMAMSPDGQLILADLTNGSSTLADYEGRMKLVGRETGAAPGQAILNLKQDYEPAGKNPAIFMGIEGAFTINQMLIEGDYQNDRSSIIRLYTRDQTGGDDGFNNPYNNMNETLTLKGENQNVGVGGVADPLTKLHTAGAITFDQSAAPADPADGSAVMWMDSATGDVLMKVTSGAVTKTVTLIDFSAV